MAYYHISNSRKFGIIIAKKGSFKDAVQLFNHLDIYYSKLHKDHISFELNNASQLKQGGIITNEEKDKEINVKLKE